MPPLEMIERYSADAVRYWAASTSPGKDSVISEEKIQMGARLVTKLWNVARFAEPFIRAASPEMPENPAALTPADRWLLAGCRALIERVTAAFEDYEYTAAKAEIETFFWHNLADNYIEMAKQRLYDPLHPAHAGAAYTLRIVLRSLLKLLAPLLPYITEAIWGELYAADENQHSIHRSLWPQPEEMPVLADPPAHLSPLEFGDLLVEIATAVRRYKSENNLSLGAELDLLQLAPHDPSLAAALQSAPADLISVARVRRVEIRPALDADLINLGCAGEKVEVGLRI
jgi:valyl-tRNA synthetase